MNNSQILMNPNKLAAFLQKEPREFNRKDILRFIKANNLRRLNFRYVAEDGHLKTLDFVVNSRRHLDELLSTGERVDGSSLFSFMEQGQSDLYLIPRFRTALLNPFQQEPTLELFCSFYTHDGSPLGMATENILRAADQRFKARTGLDFMALGELEYYMISPADPSALPHRGSGYHLASPFVKWEGLRDKAMELLSEMGVAIKYAHSEAGCFTEGGFDYEQHEIEFRPAPAEEAARSIILAKWVLRKLAHQQGVRVSFAPKISPKHAGSGLHVHMQLERGGQNVMLEGGELSLTARKAVAGWLDSADLLTAFGNTTPTSYLRLVPGNECPTSICWGDRNRSVLVRVPLGWNLRHSMIHDANPFELDDIPDTSGKQTVEIRSGDGSANAHLYMAALIMTALHGLEMDDQKALDLLRQHRAELGTAPVGLPRLPGSCSESARALLGKRQRLERDGVFPASTIDKQAQHLADHHDEDLAELLADDPTNLDELVRKHLHCG